MATGKRVPIGEMPTLGTLPAGFVHVVERCLAEDPDLRWQSARDVKAELEWFTKSQGAPATAGVRRSLAKLICAIAGLGIVGIGVTAVLVFHRQPAAAPLASQFSLESQSHEDTVGTGINATPVPSPDGHYLLIEGNDAHGGPMLWLRPIDSEEARPLAGTEGVTAGGFWSPDGQWVGFYAGGKLKKVRTSGGAPQTIASVPGVQEAAWGAGGDILIRPSNREPLFRISESESSLVQVTHLDASRTENSHRYQGFLPDGRRFLFTARCGERENNSLYLGSLDTVKVKRLMRIDSQARYLPGKNGGAGVLVYYLEGALVSRVFDPDREEVSGEPLPVYQGVAYAPASLSAFFSISEDGRVAVIRRGVAGQNQLTWFERSGKPAGTLGPRGDFMQPRISPDGSRVAVAGPDPQTGNRDVFVIDVVRGTSSRLTTHVANDWYPVWSPDGKQLLFGSDRDGGTELATFLKRSLEASAEETRYPGHEPTDWSRDGRWIVFGTHDLGVAAAAQDGKSFAFLATRFQESTGRFSPDGLWLAYSSNEGGQFDVYVRPFAGGPAGAEGKIQISAGGGDFPVWRKDGKELYYMDAGGTIFAVDMQSLGRNVGVPRATRLFHACPGTVVQPLPVRGVSYGQSYDTMDGKRFLVTCAAESPGRYTVLMNWRFGKS
jgi:Tol biopolymer transport system component